MKMIYSYVCPESGEEFYVQRLSRNDLYYVIGGRDDMRLDYRLKSGGHGTAEAAQRTLELMAHEYGWVRADRR